MKLGLKKKSFKSLSADNKKLPNDATPAVAGGRLTDYDSNHCFTYAVHNCDSNRHSNDQATECCGSAWC